jgi:hypothetical protein
MVNIGNDLQIILFYDKYTFNKHFKSIIILNRYKSVADPREGFWGLNPPQHHEKYILKINNFMNEKKNFFFFKV